MSDARRHLQPELFDSSEFEGPVSHLPERAEVEKRREAYGTVHGARAFGNIGANPIYDTNRYGEIRWSGTPSERAERGKFIPTESIVSGQPQISRDAVTHLVENSTGLDTPDIDVLAGEGGTYALRDGNHRVNAALQRGQLLIPAEVRKIKGRE